MSKPPARTVEFYDQKGVVHVRVDSPGLAAQSAPIPDVLATITDLAKVAGFEVDDSVPGELYVSWPASG